MNTDDIKREFINLMEKKHSGYLFPKKYFGVMMAIFVEQEPITQDRIVQLTKYSRTTISQMLKLVQINFQLRIIKKPGIRKKYYSIDLSIQDFMFKFFTSIIDRYKNKLDFMTISIGEIKPYSKKHRRFKNFLQYLENYYKFSKLYIDLLTNTEEHLESLVRTGKLSKEFIAEDVLSSEKKKEYLKNLFHLTNKESEISDLQIRDEESSKKYDELKQKYYERFRENLTLSNSPTSIARMIIGTELLLEQRSLTQEEIEKATNLQRSVISDTLNLLLKIKMINLTKKPGDRKNYYNIIQSWDSRTINRLKSQINSSVEMKGEMHKLSEKVKILNTNDKNNSFIKFLEQMYQCYEKFEEYFKLLEIKYLEIRLKELRSF